ncbi:DUF6522 family protein [Algihabitans albus]|uniref:DUF6522 family protein n=1 Tax=Algihabitans albus TaxID=2164067 RepID=UPI000E5CF4AC|nr:DUF6522 family protein [Algihabitans albus]
MKVELTEDGAIVSAEDIAPYLDLAPAAVPELLRKGALTTFYERGEGADAGRFRLTFKYRGASVRFTCAADGTVLGRFHTQTVR